jgi:hypothetical protein
VTDRALELQEQAEYSRTHTIDEIRRKHYGDDVIGDERGALLPAQITAQSSAPPLDEPEPEPTPGNLFETTIENTSDAAELEDLESHDLVEDAVDGVEVEDMRKWERKVRAAVKRGKAAATVRFESDIIPELTQERVRAALKSAATPDEVTRVFRSASELPIPVGLVDKLEAFMNAYALTGISND